MMSEADTGADILESYFMSPGKDKKGRETAVHDLLF